MSLALPKRQDVEPAQYVLPDEDFYEARFLNNDNPVPSSFVNKRTGEYDLRIRLVFEITEEESEFKGTEVAKYCDFDFNALNKKSLYHVLAALDPETDPEEAESLDVYLNRKCRIGVKHTAPKLNANTGQMVTYANVDIVKPFKKAKKAAEVATNGKAAKAAPANPFTEADDE